MKIEIKQEIKKEYSKFAKDFSTLENLEKKYNKRFFTKLVCTKEKPGRLLGHNGIIFLQHSLTRSNNLYLGFINCINNINRSLSFFAVRAQFEVTGSIAYFFKNLKKFYSKQISYEDLDNILYKLSLGGRVFPDRNLVTEFPEAINILTLIDSTDSDFKEYRGEDSKPFRESYDFLSEFCHPNLLGLTIGSEIIEEGIIKFCKRPNLNEGDYGVLLNLLIMSIEYFFHLYDKSFNLIKKNEDIPYLEK